MYFYGELEAAKRSGSKQRIATAKKAYDDFNSRAGKIVAERKLATSKEEQIARYYRDMKRYWNE